MLLCWLLPAKDTMATETPTYRVTQSFGEVEIREYSAQLVAETDISGIFFRVRRETLIGQA